MNKFFLIISVLILSESVYAAPIYNTDNGHYYEVFEPGNSGYTWEQANLLASTQQYSNLQGHLATITSQNEFDWITSNLDYEGKFLGGSDATTEGVWEWVTGEAFSFAAWEPGEPNNWNNLNEDYIMFWWENNDPVALWNDTVNDPSPWFLLGFIVEYDDIFALPDPVATPEPPTFLLLAMAGIMVLQRSKAWRFFSC